MRALKLADAMLFLSTLSLRRATYQYVSSDFWGRYFYPRSPCGERRHPKMLSRPRNTISIHALLAESDKPMDVPQYQILISIHALLAESDHSTPDNGRMRDAISIHALLAESDGKSNKLAGLKLVFLSTLSLRRATFSAGRESDTEENFYPRSPCGERPA